MDTLTWLNSNIEKLLPMQSEEYVDYTVEGPGVIVKKSPVSRVLSFLPLVLAGLFVFYLLRKK